MIEILIFILFSILAILFLFKNPEATFALFLVAGFFKGDPRIERLIPEWFDITIVLGIIVVFVILFNILKRKLKIPHISSKFFIPYIILIFLMFVSLIYTCAPDYGQDKFLRFLFITSLAIFVPLFIFKNKKSLHRFFYTLIALSSLMVLESLISTRAISTGFHVVFGSSYLALGRITGIVSLIIMYYFLLKSDKLKKKFFWLLLLELNLFGLFYGGGRAPVIFFIFVVILGFLFNISFKISKNKLKIIKVGVVVFILCCLMIFFLPDIFSTFFSRVGVMLEQSGGGESVATRIDLYKSAVNSFFMNPISGLGLGGFSIYHDGIDKKSYPHNIILEISSELGIFGLFIFSFFLGFCFFYLMSLRKVYKKKEGSSYLLINVIFLVYMYMFFNALVSGDINDNRLFFVWIGVAYSLRTILKKEKNISIHEKNIANKKII